MAEYTALKQVYLEIMNHSSDINKVMINKFSGKNNLVKEKLFFLLLILFIARSYDGNCQSITNLEVFYLLTDSLVDKITKDIPAEEVQLLLDLNLGQSYSLFSNNIKTRFSKYGKETFDIQPNDINTPRINIVLEGAGVEYGEMFKDGWFGSHYVQRYSTIFGNYLQTYSVKEKIEFEFTRLDTVKVEDIKYLENDSFPFTKGAVPPEPFISGLAEPLLAIGTAAAVVVLFFTIRSK